MQFQCPKCQSLLEAGADLAGQVVACPCETQLRVPVIAEVVPQYFSSQRDDGTSTEVASGSRSLSEQPTSAGRHREFTLGCKCGRRLKAVVQGAADTVQCPCGLILPLPESFAPNLKGHAPPAKDSAADIPLTPLPPPKQHTTAPQPVSWLDQALLEKPTHGPTPTHLQDRPLPRRRRRAKRSIGNQEIARYESLVAEANIKSVGVVLILAALMLYLFAIMAYLVFSGRVDTPDFPLELGPNLAITFTILVLGTFYLVAGIGLRLLQRWARTLSCIACGFGVAFFPIGTIASIYFLSLLLSRDSDPLFTPEHHEVIELTPHIQLPMTLTMRLLLSGTMMALALGGLAALFVWVTSLFEV